MHASLGARNDDIQKNFHNYMWRSCELIQPMDPCLCAKRHIESSFHQCGGAVELVHASLNVQRDPESSFHHCGGVVKLLHGIFSAGKDVGGSFLLLWRYCVASSCLFKC